MVRVTGTGKFTKAVSKKLHVAEDEVEDEADSDKEKEEAKEEIVDDVKENADDAGAREFKVMLDGRSGEHGTATLLSPALAPMQGPALLQFDDAVFSSDDFTSTS